MAFYFPTKMYVKECLRCNKIKDIIKVCILFMFSEIEKKTLVFNDAHWDDILC